MRGHTCGLLDGVSADAEATGDQVVGDITPPSRGSMIVTVERSVRRSPIEEEMANNPAQGPSRAEKRIARGALGNEFVLDTVLLVSKEDPHRLNSVEEVYVITKGIKETRIVARIVGDAVAAPPEG